VSFQLAKTHARKLEAYATISSQSLMPRRGSLNDENEAELYIDS
jgi:hypothetical protein